MVIFKDMSDFVSYHLKFKKKALHISIFTILPKLRIAVPVLYVYVTLYWNAKISELFQSNFYISINPLDFKI